MKSIAYDEFGLFHENASEYGLPFAAPPIVRRASVTVPGGRMISALVWGTASPDIVFIHGGAQNAHTWDTTAMAIGRSAVAVDLPGHGHSDWRDDGAYTPANLADDVANVVRSLACDAALVVGMSLGGMTSIELTARHPALVRALMLVDITPGVNGAKAKAVIDFVNGPQSFASFEALLDRTKEHNPTRAESSLRRGILHNARQLPDGSWQWRYDRRGRARSTESNATSDASDTLVGLSPMWDHLESVRCPLTLIRGAMSPVVDDDDVTEFRRRQPAAVVEVVEGAGHSVQGDRPLELAALIEAALLRR